MLLKTLQNLSLLLQQIWINHKRFPLTLLCSLLITISGIILIELGSNKHLTPALEQHSVDILLAISLGIPLFFSIENQVFKQNKIVFYIIFTFITIFFYFSKNNHEVFNLTYIIRYLVLAIVAHLVVSVLPLGLPIKEKQNEFWHYNKNLLTAIITSFTYTGVLFIGLAFALLAIENLFNVKIDGQRYAQLFIISNLYFNTHIFVSKSDQFFRDEEQQYPVGLKYFAQYVLLPLVIIYLGILYAYEAKIIAAWNLPKGWVSLLIMACSAVGILSFLLLYPLRTANTWVARFTKFFYYALIPLLGLLGAAIYERIRKYGITEPRYFLVILGIWLACITLYFIISKADNIKIIPMSLTLLGVFSIVGPMSSFSVSKRSQVNEMNEVLNKNNMLVNGLIDISKKIELSSVDSKKLNSTIAFLIERKEIDEVKKLFKNQNDTIFTKPYVSSYDIMQLMPNVSTTNFDDELNVFLSRENIKVTEITGFDYLISCLLDENANIDIIDLVNFKGLELKNNTILIKESTETIPLDGLIKELQKNTTGIIDVNEGFVTKETKNYSIKIRINTVNINNLVSKPSIKSISFEVFLRRK